MEQPRYRLPWGWLWGGLLWSLGGRRRWPQRGGISEASPWYPRLLPGLSAARVIECRAAAKRHCLGSFFFQGGLVVCEIRRVEILGMVEDLHWLGGIIELLLCDIMHMLEFKDMFLEFRNVGWSRGQFWGQLYIFRVSVTLSRIGR